MVDACTGYILGFCPRYSRKCEQLAIILIAGSPEPIWRISQEWLALSFIMAVPEPLALKRQDCEFSICPKA